MREINIEDLFKTLKEQQNFVHLEKLGKNTTEQLETLTKYTFKFNRELFEKLKDGKLTEKDMYKTLDDLSFMKSAYARLNNKLEEEVEKKIFKQQEVFNPLISMAIMSHILLTIYVEGQKEYLDKKTNQFKNVFGDISKNFNDYKSLTDKLYFLSEKNLEKVAKEILKTADIKALNKKYTALIENLNIAAAKNILKKEKSEKANIFNLAVDTAKTFDKKFGLNKENVAIVKDYINTNFGIDLSIKDLKAVKELNKLNFDFEKHEFKNAKDLLNTYTTYLERGKEKEVELER